ncbi:MAG: hypothetical protein A3F18_06300 [Legionellales bacterium RIFCSPHIGHO2_12_FULL_37_14]|nr:MAG: hypothetical protein A3F18_06300 [Legionellales bacterium RIFCSPHIGHO2_12_FULL_37_14]
MIKKLILYCAILLTSCGFHLRGIVNLPRSFNYVAIVNENQHVSPSFIQTLKSTLYEQHVNVVDDPSKAKYFIILLQNRFNQVLTNVAASTVPRQYQLSYSVQFQVTENKGAVLLPAQTITILREVTINNDRILGSKFESDLIENEMHQNAATQLLARISARLMSL